MTPSPDTHSANYVVAIGDLVGSRQLEDRASARERLRDVVEAFNVRAGDTLAALRRLLASYRAREDRPGRPAPDGPAGQT